MLQVSLDATYLKTFINELETLTAAETSLLNTMIKAARELCEEYTNKAFAQKTIEAFYEEEEVANNDRYITLPYIPHVSVTSVTPYDYKGTAQTALVAGVGYYQTGLTELEVYIPAIVATVGEDIALSDYKIIYVCGYGAPGCEAIPSALKQVMASIISRWWAKRDAWVPVLDQEAKAGLSMYEDLRL